MGQYYKAYVKRENKKPLCFDPWRYDSGAKLLEHSWLGNSFVNAVIEEIEDDSAVLAWVGDYSYDETGDNGVKADKDVYDACWGDNAKEERKRKVKRLFLKENDEYNPVGYFVNHTKKEYVDIKEYAKEAIHEDWVVNPLPILTSVGNGLGGGDYYESSPNYDMVGYWYLDEISFTYDKPDYKDITQDCIFKDI